MTCKFVLFFVIALFISGSPSFAEDDKVAFGFSRPPFVMRDKGTGISVELFRAVYRKLGRTFSPSYVGNVRLERSLESGIVDVAVEVKKTNPEMFYSAPFTVYRNFIIMRTNGEFQVNAFADLKGKSVCTWQNADKHLGPKFQAAMSTFRYIEFANQQAQVKVFLGGRCDIIIIDQTIFRFWAESLQKDQGFEKSIISLDFKYQPVPGQVANEFYVGFRDQSLRDKFDAALNKLKTDGVYDEIYNWKDWSRTPSM
jgi:polar amino acid transport system substrate-binding protein